ncbi:MAG: Smr/MutS family protein [Xanthobacteraceae bacterium]|jgi:DNA-nicking Smr family endonuclease
MSRRRLSDDERALWRGFARGVTPLRHSAGAPLDVAPDQAVREMPPPAQSVPKERAHAKQPPALAQFDRRLRQRVARGRAAIDARLDLHGMTQKQAHGALLRFLAQAQAQDAKLALVVTGKGIGGAADSASERGVLRRQVPLWLPLPEFRRFIVSFQQAHASHGGEGALYLRLRRRPR